MKCSQCHNDFDEFYTFCPHCGKEREQAAQEKGFVTNETSFLIRPIDQEKSAAYEENIAFFRYVCSSPLMLTMILLLLVSSLFSLYQIVDSLSISNESQTIFEVVNGSPVLSIISFIIAAFPLIGLSIVYFQAKRPFALDGSGFHLIGLYAKINIWLYRVLGILLALFALLLIFSSYAPILIAYIPTLFVIPYYLLLLAVKDLCEMIENSIDRDPVGTLPYPDRVQQWLKFLTIEYVIISLLTLLVVFVFDTPNQWSEAVSMLRDNLWMILLQSAIFGVAWHYVKNYAFQLLIRKKANT